MRSFFCKPARPAVLIVVAMLQALSGCRGTAPQSQANSVSPKPPSAAEPQLTVNSVAFKAGTAIPRQYTCDGINISPPIEWSGTPGTARTIALIADDPDAPAGTWIHWVLYNLPAENIGLVENLPASENLKAAGLQGRNDFKQIGYGGPCPPSGTHRYFFKIYALDAELPLKAGATRGELEKAMAGHIVAQGQLMGTYRR